MTYDNVLCIVWMMSGEKDTLFYSEVFHYHESLSILTYQGLGSDESLPNLDLFDG